MWNSLPQEQGQQTRTTGNSTSVLLKNLLPGLNYTVVVAAVTERLERFFEGNLSVPLTFTTMTGSKYIIMAMYIRMCHLDVSRCKASITVCTQLC